MPRCDRSCRLTLDLRVTHITTSRRRLPKTCRPRQRSSKAEETLPQVQQSTPSLWIRFPFILSKPSKSPLRKLPQLHPRYENKHSANRQRPLPRNRFLLENLVVEARYVNAGENDERAKRDGVEEEFVGVDVFEERKPGCAVRVEMKHAAPDALDLPGRYQDQPSQFGEHSRASTEHQVAVGAPHSVALMP